MWTEHCIGSQGDSDLDLPSVPAKKLCIIAFLPNILDSKAAGREKYIALLKQAAEKYKDRPFSYLWAQGGAQGQLESNFDVGGYVVVGLMRVGSVLLATCLKTMHTGMATQRLLPFHPHTSDTHPYDPRLTLSM